VVSDEGLEVGSEKAVQEGCWTAGSRMGKKKGGEVQEEIDESEDEDNNNNNNDDDDDDDADANDDGNDRTCFSYHDLFFVAQLRLPKRGELSRV